MIRLLWKPPAELRVRTWAIVAIYLAWLAMAVLVVGPGQ